MSDGYLRHHESGTMKWLKKQKTAWRFKVYARFDFAISANTEQNKRQRNSQSSQHSSSTCTISAEEQDTEDVGETMIHEQTADISDDRLETEQLEQAKEKDNTTSSDNDKKQIVIELRNP